MAFGRVVMYHPRGAQAFSAGIEYWNCMYGLGAVVAL